MASTRGVARVGFDLFNLLEVVHYVQPMVAINSLRFRGPRDGCSQIPGGRALSGRALTSTTISSKRPAISSRNSWRDCVDLPSLLSTVKGRGTLPSERSRIDAMT